MHSSWQPALQRNKCSFLWFHANLCVQFGFFLTSLLVYNCSVYTERPEKRAAWGSCNIAQLMHTPHSHCRHACHPHFFTLTALPSVLRHWCASRQHVLITQGSASVPVLTKCPYTARHCPAMAQPMSMSSKGTVNVNVKQRHSQCQMHGGCWTHKVPKKFPSLSKCSKGGPLLL